MFEDIPIKFFKGTHRIRDPKETIEINKNQKSIKKIYKKKKCKKIKKKKIFSQSTKNIDNSKSFSILKIAWKTGK